MTKNILNKIERTKLARSFRSLVGFGLVKHNPKIIESLRRSRRYANIVLVGPRSLRKETGFRVIRDQNPEKRLASMLVHGKVDGIVRGTLDDFKTFEAYRDLVGIKATPNTGEFGLMEDALGRQFFLTQASNPYGWTREQKRRDCATVIRFMRYELGVEPTIGFITGVRHATYQRRRRSRLTVQRQLNRTYEDAEHLAAYFQRRGIKAKNYAIEIETALNERCNVIVPPNGMVGNQIFRALVFLGKGKNLMCPRVNLFHPYEDNSRNETNFENHVRFLVSWIRKRKSRRR